MFRISKDFHFSAAHQLPNLPENHPCGRPHGHNYIVRLVYESEGLDHRGFVVDYGELFPFRDYLDRHVEHRNLNDVFTRTPTTAENLAKLFYEAADIEIVLPPHVHLAEVWVSETPKTWAVYKP